MTAVYDWLKGMLSEMRIDVKPPQSTPITTLGEFLDSHHINTLVVNGEVDARSNLSALPLQEPRGALLVRYEPDTKHIYIAANQFKKFCVEQQTNYKSLLKQLTDLNIFIEVTNKRMSKGMKIASPVVRALKFDASNSEFLRMDEILNINENRDGGVPA
jgi:hypothetical protein